MAAHKIQPNAEINLFLQRMYNDATYLVNAFLYPMFDMMHMCRENLTSANIYVEVVDDKCFCFYTPEFHDDKQKVKILYNEAPTSYPTEAWKFLYDNSKFWGFKSESTNKDNVYHFSVDYTSREFKRLGELWKDPRN